MVRSSSKMLNRDMTDINPDQSKINTEDVVIRLEGKMSEMCEHAALRANFIALCFLLSTCSFCFFLINFQMKYLEGSLIQNNIFFQSAELISNATSGYLYFIVGPRKAFSMSFFLSIVGCIFLMIFGHHTTWVPYLILWANLGVSAAFNMCFIGFVELIPTIFRSRVFGIGNTFARGVTGMAAEIAEIPYPFPIILQISLLIIAIGFSNTIVTKMPRFI